MKRHLNKSFDMQDCLTPEPSTVCSGKAPSSPKPPKRDARIDGTLRGPEYPPPAPAVGTDEWVEHCERRGSSEEWTRNILRQHRDPRRDIMR
jgi:hypothetical protein